MSNTTSSNSRMSSVRRDTGRGAGGLRHLVHSLEWQFGKILQEFAFLDFRKKIKVLLQPVGKYYTVGALLANCHTCIYESQTGDYFGLNAPTQDEYLSKPPVET